MRREKVSTVDMSEERMVFDIPVSARTVVFTKVRDHSNHHHGKPRWEELARRIAPIIEAHGGRRPTGPEFAKWVNDSVQKKNAPDWFLREWRTRNSQWSEEPAENAPTTEEASTEQPEPIALLVRAEIAGLPLEVVGGEWVTLRSLFDPFGKTVDKQIERLSSWANVRKFHLPSRSGDENVRGNPPRETWAIHRSHAAQAIGELDPRGMDESVRTAFVAFKRECANALDAYFTKGVATNPRIQPSAQEEAFKLLGWRTEKLDADMADVKKMASEASDRVRAQGASIEAVARAAAQAQQAAEAAHAEAKRLAAHRIAPELVAVPDRWRPDILIAEEKSLPSKGPGGKIVESICDATGMSEQPQMTKRCAWKGKAVLALSPLCVEKLQAAFFAAHRCLHEHGYQVRGRVMVPRDDVKPGRSAAWVRNEMLVAAVRESSPQVPLRLVEAK